MDVLAFYKALADETRLKSVLLIVQQGELCVCELMEALQLSQPKISRHLALLRQIDILCDRRQGQWVYYQLNPNLPDWALQILQLSAQHNHDLLQVHLNQLCQMDGRPTQRPRCC